MKYQIIQPPVILQDYVRYFWTLDYDGSVQDRKAIKIPADGSAGFLLQHHNGKSATAGGEIDFPTAFVYGQATTNFTTHTSSGFSMTGAYFYPATLKTLFGIDACELTGGCASLENFTSLRLEEMLINATCPHKRITILTDFLIKKINYKKAADALIAGVITQIKTAPETLSVGELLKENKVSERQLERRFKQFIGIPPKMFIRLTRFENAQKRLRLNQFDKISDVAYDLGYSDHSHFNRDFKEFSSFIPTTYLKAINEFDGFTSFSPEEKCYNIQDIAPQLILCP